MKDEKNITFIPPVPPKKAASDAAPKVEKNAPAKQKRVSDPKSPALKKTQKKPTPPPKQVQPLSDDALEEALDDALPEEHLIEEIPVDEPEEVPVAPQRLSIFQRRQQQKRIQEEQKLSVFDLIRNKTNLSEDDIALILELGYENELGRLTGYENLTRLKTEHLKSTSRHDSLRYHTAFGYRGEEFTSSRRNSIAAAYREDLKLLICRLVFTVLLSFALFLLESPHLLGETVVSLQNAHPTLFLLGTMLLFAVCAAFSHRQIYAGLRAFFRFTPTPYSICALIPLLVIPYDLIDLFTKTALFPVHFLFSLLFVVMAVCDLFRIRCEMSALRLLSADGIKNVLTHAVPRKKKLRQGDKIVKVVNDDLGKDMYKVEQANDTLGFFRRFNCMGTAIRPVFILILLPIALALMTAFATAVYTSSFFSALSAFMEVLTLSTPISAFFTFFFPLFRANRLLGHHNCALIGEEAVEELQANNTVIFRDTALYTIESHTVVSMQGGESLRNDLRLASILFRKMGGTLAPLGEAVPSLRTDPPVSFVRIQETGVEAMIDNRFHILAGDAEFLKRGGVRVPKENPDKVLHRTKNTSVMYLAVDGIPKLLYEIKYQTKPEMERMISSLSDAGHAVAVQSYDPNLNETFLQKSRAEEPDPVVVVKSGRFEEEKPVEITDTAAVALGRFTDTTYPLYAAGRIRNVRRFGLRMQVIASILGACACLLLTITGLSQSLEILHVLGYQLFWSLVMIASAYTEINGEKLHFQKHATTTEEDDQS